jgi:O-antigen/teichoic acid export membrane protein
MIKKLFSNSMIYVLSLLFNKGLSFILLPVLTYYLTKEDYGVLGLVTAISTIASIYIGFFPSGFLLAKLAQYGKEKMAEYMHHILLLTIATTSLVLLILIGFQHYLLPENLENKTILMVVITLYAMFTIFFRFIDTLLQVEQNAIKFAVLQTLQSVGALGLALVLIIEFSYGWKGKYYAELLILFFVFIYAIYYIIKNKYYKYNTDYKKLKELFVFLLPLTFSVLGLYLMGTIDRIFVSNMLGLEASGVYNVAITMAIIINMVYDSISKALNPILYENLVKNEKDNRIKIVKLIYLYSIICVIIFGFFILFLPYIFHLMINIKFEEALNIIPILAVGFTFEGLRKVLEAPLVFKHKMKSLAVITLIAGLIDIILNYFLIKLYGINGAAYSTLISFLVLYIISFFLVVKEIKLPWFLSEK